MITVELADLLIRAFDLAGYLDLDLANAVLDKLDYNQNRADHKLENRVKEGGKRFKNRVKYFTFYY
jgi:NTP pyrophosphatase (non-canonical NTP hydrolase)